MHRKSIRDVCLSAAVVLGGVMLTQGVQADGTETLGIPTITIASGTGVVAAGTGLLGQPGLIDFDVPGTPVQTIAYWECFQDTAATPLDDEIVIGGVPVTGALIGGPAFFFSGAYSSVHRADITGLVPVNAGLNMLSVEGLDCSSANNGAGVLVIYDDLASDISDIQVRDGADTAFINFPDPRKLTIPQAFNFDSAGVERTAALSMFFSSVSGSASTGNFRPSSIQVTVGGVVTLFSNLLDSVDEDEWDSLNLDVAIPAGAETLTVQAFSRDDNGDGQNPLAASFVWSAAALSVPLPSPPPPVLSCIDGKPVELVFAYTPSGCSTTNEQEGKFSCSGVLDSAIASVASPDGTITFTGSTVTITAPGDKFGAQTDMAITDVNGNVQDISIHTSCSKELNVGDIFGSLELTVFVPGTSGGGMGGMGGMGM